jgi:hypothetical protein
MGNSEANAILAKLGGHIRQSESGRALKLIDVHEEWSAIRWWRIGSTKGGKSDQAGG